jgi:hypothetical protein
MPQPIFVKLGMYIMAPERTYINLSHQSICLYVYSSIVARQRLGENIIMAPNTHATIQELLDASFSMQTVS